MFGLYEQVSVWGAVLTIPIFAWELSLAFRLIIKGFNESEQAESSTHSESDLQEADGLAGSLAN
jgi:hypothetical protein